MNATLARFRTFAPAGWAIGLIWILSGCSAATGSGDATGGISPPWNIQMGAAGAITAAHAISTDTSGFVYVAGETGGGLNGITPSGGNNFFIAKFTTAGVLVWLKELSAAGAIHTQGVGSDSTGNVYVTGSTDGAFAGKTQIGTRDIFVASYSADGTLGWVIQVGTAGATAYSKGVKVGASGNIYLAGDTNRGLNGNSLTGTRDLFAAKYSASGTPLWTKQLGAVGGSANTLAMDLDTFENIYLTGDTNRGLAGNPLVGTSDCFLVKYNLSGTRLWNKEFGVSGSACQGTGVKVGGSGSVYVAGGTSGNLGGTGLSGSYDIFITQYDSNGNPMWLKQFGAAGADNEANGLAIDASENTFIVGQVNAGLDGNTLTGVYDAFVSKFNSAGTRLSTEQLGATGATSAALAASVDSSGALELAGSTNGGLSGNTLTGTQDYFVFQIK